MFFLFKAITCAILMFILVRHEKVKFLDGVMEPLVFLNKMMIIIWPAAIAETEIHGAPRTC